MRRSLAEAAALTRREREAMNLYALWGKRAHAIVAERGSALVGDVSTMLEGEGTVYWRSGRECVAFEHSHQQCKRCVNRRRSAQRSALPPFARARIPQRTLTIALRPAEP